MSVGIRQVDAGSLSLYAQVPTAFWVESTLQAELMDAGLGGIVLREKRTEPPYLKDYDAGGGPTRWPARFDTSNWCFLLALEDDRPVGGATVAFDTPGVRMLAGRSDIALLWDIRVHPDRRGQGLGTQLFRRAVQWSRRHGCRLLKIETQNVNVAACRFHAAQGCELGTIDRYGYAGQPQYEHEVMLLWYFDLRANGPEEIRDRAFLGKESSP